MCPMLLTQKDLTQTPSSKAGSESKHNIPKRANINLMPTSAGEKMPINCQLNFIPSTHLPYFPAHAWQVQC